MTFGIDYGSVDGNKPPHIPTLLAAGLGFVWLRASFAYFDKHHGAWAVVSDPVFARDWAAFSAVPRGAYMFPVLEASQTPEEQVATFYQAVKAQGGLRPSLDFPPCLDVEFPEGIKGTGLDRAGVLAWITRAAAEMRRLFGLTPIIYTSGRVWNDTDADCLGNPPAPPGLVPCHLWLARYPYKTREPAVLPPPSTLAAPPVPGPWGDEWIAHQYQGDALGVPGMTATVDLDRWRFAQPGDKGGHVRTYRGELGLPLGDLYDDDMRQAVLAVQAQAGLVTDAIIGPRTACAIISKP